MTELTSVNRKYDTQQLLGLDVCAHEGTSRKAEDFAELESSVRG